jgi:hypothetical protein
MNTREQGDIGVAQAIYWYTLNGFKVSIPNTESTRYDLIIEKDGKFQRVQCKTTFAKSSYGIPILALRTLGGNRSWGGTVKKINSAEVDIVWASVDGTSAYVFPAELIEGMSSLHLGEKYKDYKVI